MIRSSDRVGQRRRRILFVGFNNSTHTHEWIDLLEDSEFDVRLFSLPGSVPPVHWKVKTYITSPAREHLDRKMRVNLCPFGYYSGLVYKNFMNRFWGRRSMWLESRWLGKVIRSWKPDAVHTLGLEPAGYFYMSTARTAMGPKKHKWIAQVRGGPDLALHRLLPDYATRIHEVLGACDVCICDNQKNYDYAVEMGLSRSKVSALGAVPGTGGIDIESLSARRKTPASRSRLILYPKAYDCPQSKALPVFEALRLCWQGISPCEIYMTAMTDESRMWMMTLPEEMRKSIKPLTRIPRDNLLDILAGARIMLAPSLSDGVPNTLYEAMAAGAFPIVSPLETIVPLVKNERNVLFARNLYPHEIAEALIRAMSDDALVDAAVRNNVTLVKQTADRKLIRDKVLQFYSDLVAAR